MGQGPNKTTCIRRFPKGDRKALWSPVRAKPSPWIKDDPFLIRYLLHVFPTATKGLSGRPLGPFGVPSDESFPSNKQRIIPHTNNPPSPSGLGEMGQGSNKTTCIRRFPKGDRKALWSPVRAKPHLVQKHTIKGKTHTQTIPQALLGLGDGSRANGPCGGVGGRAPDWDSKGQSPLVGVVGAMPPPRGVGGRAPAGV